MNAWGTKQQMKERHCNQSKKNIWWSLTIKQPHIEILGLNIDFYFFRYLSIDTSTEFVHCTFRRCWELEYFLDWRFCIIHSLWWCNTLSSNYFLDAKQIALNDVQPWTSLSFICQTKPQKFICKYYFCHQISLKQYFLNRM